VLPRLAYLTRCRSIQLLALLARGDAAKDLESEARSFWSRSRGLLWLLGQGADDDEPGRGLGHVGCRVTLLRHDLLAPLTAHA
jgi:hypothetical protein